MPEIQHRVGIYASIQRVHDHLATLQGLADVWTTKIEGDPAPGGELRFYFKGSEPSAVMEVTEVSPDDEDRMAGQDHRGGRGGGMRVTGDARSAAPVHPARTR